MIIRKFIIKLFFIFGLINIVNSLRIETLWRKSCRIISTSVIISSVITNPTRIDHGKINNGLSHAFAANLPEYNGAKGDKRGTPEALVPILKMQSAITEIKSYLPFKLEEAKVIEKFSFPLTEKEFKKVFDEFSVDISYKQQYLDKNAFLVYYTKGFDGPKRSSIETEDDQMKLQTAQYGYRNDAWVAIDDLRSELDYLTTQDSSEKKDLKDLNDALNRAEIAIVNYISLAPEPILEIAKRAK